MRFVLIAVSFIALAACATASPTPTYPISPSTFDKSGEFISTGGYRFVGLDENGSSPELLVLVSFSGGGKRSSAFGYGVLKGLRDTTIFLDGRQRRLLDEVDIMTSVSGGSFPAAYYGLHRDRIFTNFAQDFLYQDIDSHIRRSFLFGSNDSMQQLYDDLMFHGATYADLARNGRPLISVNATDVTYGTVFPFTQDQFDLICADLMPVPLSRAVAASNGFPVLFAPITLESQAGQCGGRVPRSVRDATDMNPLSRRDYLAENARAYLDPNQTRYVHLMDGGISDNLAMRSVINTMVLYSDEPGYIRRAGLDRVRRILVISADGQALADTSKAKSPTLSGLRRIFDAVSGTQIDRYNFETLILVNEELERLRDNIIKQRCAERDAIMGPCDDVKSYFVHLSLGEIADPAERVRLERIRTGLTLPNADVDMLAAAGETLVRGSPVMQAFDDSLGGANRVASAQ
jgi:NTE family protein